MTTKEIEDFVFFLLKNRKFLTEETKEFLSDDARRQLVRDFREAKEMGADDEAKIFIKQLFDDIEKLLYKIAHKLAYNKDDVNDLVADGTIAFVKAIAGDEENDTGFDPDGGIPFQTSIIKTIKGGMLNWLKRERRHSTKHPVSMDATINTDDGEADLYNVEKLADEDDTQGGVLESEILDILDLDIFSYKERQLIIAYHGLNGVDRKTYKELGDELGISKQGVQFIINKALKKLKTILNKEF